MTTRGEETSCPHTGDFDSMLTPTQEEARSSGGGGHFCRSSPRSSAKIDRIASSSSSSRARSRTRRTPLAPRVAPLAPEGIVAVDAVGRDDVDVNLLITCEHLECLCKASMADRLTSLIGKALSRSGGGGVHGIDAVEVCVCVCVCSGLPVPGVV